jgi:hypothetical protein
MSHRTQITLPDAQYARLREESARTGVGLAELVRRALGTTYGSGSTSKAKENLAASFGAWQGRAENGESYVETPRRGMKRRLAQ